VRLSGFELGFLSEILDSQSAPPSQTRWNFQIGVFIGEIFGTEHLFLAYLPQQPTCPVVQMVIIERDSRKGIAREAVPHLLTDIGKSVAERGTGDRN